MCVDYCMTQFREKTFDFSVLGLNKDKCLQKVLTPVGYVVKVSSIIVVMKPCAHMISSGKKFYFRSIL